MAESARKIVNRAPEPVRPAIVPVQAVVTRSCVQLRSASPAASGDRAEREADATAARIVRMTAPAGLAIKPQPADVRTRVSPHVARFADAARAMRSAGGTSALRSATPTPASSASGSPLPAPVRGFMESRFGADFGDIRIHTDEQAARRNRELHSHAFTIGNQIHFGRNRFEPGTERGRELIAHELTHTIQQGAAQQMRDESLAVRERQSGGVQRVGMDDAIAFFAERANAIPGFRLFTVILGTNPLTWARVDRNAANVLRALVEILPGGSLITRALDNHGILESVGTWVEQQFGSLGLSAASIRDAVHRFLDSLGWSDIFDLGGVWERAKRLLRDPVDRMISFAGSLARGILGFIRAAVLRPLARLIEGTRGYSLLKALLGQDPVTGDAVPRTADTLIGGFMQLIGQDEVWQNLRRANAVPRAWAWFQTASSALMGLVRSIPSRFTDLLESLGVSDLVTVTGLFEKVGSLFGRFAGDFVSWAGNATWSFLQIIFEVVAPSVMPHLQRAAGAFRTILRNPVGFVGNLVRAATTGFAQFAANFLRHLRASVLQWITGALSGSAIYVPASFAPKELLKFVLSVLGLTWQNLRQRLVRLLGETAVVALETGFDLVRTLIVDGPAAAWEKIVEQLSNLREMVLEQIMSFVSTQVVQQAIVRLVSALNPAGAFIQAILATYNTVTFFVERLRQIGQVAVSFLESIAAIASGMIAPAANRVEQTLAGMLTLVISFLARLVGLGNIGESVARIVGRVRAPVDRALDRVTEWIVTMARRVARFATTAASNLVNWWTMRQAVTSLDGEAHMLSFVGEEAAAQLMIASDPMTLEKFLDTKKEEARGGSKKEAMATLRTIVARIKAAKDLPKARYAETQRIIAREMQKAVEPLQELLTGDDVGSAATPLQLKYTKRRASAYPTILIGPRCAKPIEQKWLRSRNFAQIDGVLTSDERAEWKNRNRQIKAYLPTRPDTLPGTNTKIGIEPQFQVDVGLRVQYEASRTRGGRLINRALEDFGFRAREEDMDGDHVVEMQIGGPNSLPNLWPLSASENRSSGSKLKHAIDEAKRQIPRPPRRNSKITKNSFYIMIIECL